MDKLEILILYKELYAHELERKDTISSNIQVRFAAIATIFSLLLYIVKNIDLDVSLNLLLCLGLVAIVGLLLLGRVIYLLQKAYWGNNFDYFPYANEVENTRNDMAVKGHFKENPDVFTDYLIEEFSSCAAQIAQINDSRQRKVNLANKYFKLSLIPLAFVGLIFIFGDLDAASSRKDTSVFITNQTKCNLTTNQAKVGQL